MEIKRMPRNQFLKLTMENNKKKEYREWMQHQEHKLLKKNINVIKSLQSALFSKFNNNKRSFSCEIISNLETTFCCKLPRKRTQADQRLPYRHYVHVN